MKGAGPQMATRTATDKKAAHRIFRSQMRHHNQIVKEVDKTIMNLKRSVILIAPEDGAGDTLRPRLEAAGGDPSHVLLLNIVEGLDAKKMAVVDRPFSLSHDLELSEIRILKVLLLIVPIVNNWVRALLDVKLV